MFKNVKNIIGKVGNKNIGKSYYSSKIRKGTAKGVTEAGKVAVGTGKVIGGTIGGGIGMGARGIGKISNTVDNLTEKAFNKRFIRLENGFGNPLEGFKELGKASINMVSPFIKESKHNSLLGIRVNKVGIGLLGTGLVAAGAIGETKNYLTQTTRGQVDSSVTSFAPRLPSYSFGEQAGATGDLVFALNNNRRG